MSRGTWLAATAGLLCAGAVAAVALGAGSETEPDPRPTPQRVYSSCLAADTEPMSADHDPCAGD
ncbi:hypothetical protein [Streptomyces sp. SID5910]|uniref:hypothetical protein n=1 Tax=Streptomyces sp. SID5910 TaxID=2690312 RepID=UPI00136E4EB8|nr:hypothetical protein [Streptomyces sp. SID5910]MYR44674.1 hypothetical protein [Streptomyces sp. SID5910]